MAEDVRCGQGHARIVVEAGAVAAERGRGGMEGQVDSRISMLFMPAVPLLKIFLQPLMESWSGSPTAAAAGGANVALTWAERQVRGRREEGEGKRRPQPQRHIDATTRCASSKQPQFAILFAPRQLACALHLPPLALSLSLAQSIPSRGRPDQAGSATLYFRLVLFEDRFIVVVFLVVV